MRERFVRLGRSRRLRHPRHRALGEDVRFDGGLLLLVVRLQRQQQRIVRVLPERVRVGPIAQPSVPGDEPVVAPVQAAAQGGQIGVVHVLQLRRDQLARTVSDLAQPRDALADRGVEAVVQIDEFALLHAQDPPIAQHEAAWTYTARRREGDSLAPVLLYCRRPVDTRWHECRGRLQRCRQLAVEHGGRHRFISLADAVDLAQHVLRTPDVPGVDLQVRPAAVAVEHLRGNDPQIEPVRLQRVA